MRRKSILQPCPHARPARWIDGRMGASGAWDRIGHLQETANDCRRMFGPVDDSANPWTSASAIGPTNYRTRCSNSVRASFQYQQTRTRVL